MLGAVLSESKGCNKTCDISARALYLLAVADCEGNFVVERVAAMAEGAVRWAQAQFEARQGPGLQAAVSYCMCSAVGPT